MATDPPYSGTIYLDGKIITTADPTAFLSVTDAGQAERSMFDRRLNAWKNFNAYLFNATFDDGLAAEIQVNPEFGSSDAARIQARKYGAVIGKLPKAVRTQVKTVSIHQGVQLFGGGENLVIHTGQADQYERDGILEEALLHEACHTLDAAHSSAAAWIAAQKADDAFISTYARDNPQREDVAESFLCWLAVRYRSARIYSDADSKKILEAIPNRIAYFDAQPLDMYPITRPLKGTWTFRIFNPTFVTGNLTPEEAALIRADETVLTLRTQARERAGNLEGTLEWQVRDPSDPTKVKTEGLDLKGTFISGYQIMATARFDIVGTGRPDSTGRPGTGTDGWEYRYQGHLRFAGGDIVPILVGSVIRAKPHGDSKAGEVFSFIAVKQQSVAPPQDFARIFTGSWTYRSFHNEHRPIYETASPTANGLILQEGVFRLETPTDRTLQGTIEFPGEVLDIYAPGVRSADVPPGFKFSGAGRGGQTHYGGHLTRQWPNEASSSGVVDQRPALVGTVFTGSTGFIYQPGSMYPFIAVKQ